MLILKSKLLECFKTVKNQHTNHYFVLIVDESSLKLLTSTLKMSEILIENITSVERLEKSRQAYPDLIAIYLITPSLDSVDAFIRDWSVPKANKYSQAHLFLTNNVPDALYDKVQNSVAYKYTRSIVKLNMDFLPVESHAFTLDLPRSFFSLYSPPTASHLDFELDLIAKKIANLMMTMGEYPFIRFHTPETKMPCKDLPRNLANKVQLALDSLSRSNASYPPESLQERGVLLIMERGMDLAAPLLHEFTYQAMASDLLGVESRYSNGSKEYLLDESDAVWMETRHWHIAQVISHLSHGVKNVLTENKAGQFELGLKESTDSNLKLNQLKDAVSSLPQYQELKTKYSLHTEICKELMNLYTTHELESVSMAEQDIVMNNLNDEKIIKKLFTNLLHVLQDSRVSHNDKVRLVILYSVAVKGMHDLERQTLYERAQLSLEEAQAVTNTCILGIQFNPKLEKSLDIIPYTLLSNAALSLKKSFEFENSRFTPSLYYMVRDQILDRVPIDAFSWIKEPPFVESRPTTWAPTSSSSSSSMNNRTSIGNTKTKPSWAMPRKSTLNSLSTTNSTSQSIITPKEVKKTFSGPRLIIFIIGGMSWSEIRSCYALAKEYNREIYIGSTCTLQPDKFVEDLKHLHNSGNKRAVNPFAGSHSSPSPTSSSTFSKSPMKTSMHMDSPTRKHSLPSTSRGASLSSLEQDRRIHVAPRTDSSQDSLSPKQGNNNTKWWFGKKK